MKITQILVQVDYWKVLLENGDIYRLDKAEVMELDGAAYADLLNYLSTITIQIKTSESELIANGFIKEN